MRPCVRDLSPHCGAAVICPHCGELVRAESFPGVEVQCSACCVRLYFAPEGWRINEVLTECLFCAAVVGAACPLVARGEVPAHGRPPCARVSIGEA